MIPNKLLKDQMYLEHIYNYQMAEAIGISEETFYRWLRKPFTEEQQKRAEKALRVLIILKHTKGVI